MGCLEKKPLIDSEKAGTVAVEYMNSKYNQDFELLSCKPSKDWGIENQKSYAKAQVSLNGDIYYVNLCLSENNKSDWKVYNDSYMDIIAYPFFRNNMDNILHDELDIKKFTSYVCTRSAGFDSNFPVITENDTLKEIADSYSIALMYFIDMPESSHYEGIDEDIQKVLAPYFPHGIVDVSVNVYRDDIYSSVKEESAIFNNKDALFSYEFRIENKPYQK